MEGNYSHVGYLGVAAPLARLRYKPPRLAPKSELHSSQYKYAAQWQSAAGGITEPNAKQRQEYSLETDLAGSDSVLQIIRPVKPL